MSQMSIALDDIGKNLFKPKTMLSGGLNLPFSGMKAIRAAERAARQPMVAAPAPQAARAPDRAALGAGLSAMMGGPMAGTSSTFLTGPAGAKGGNLGKALLGE